ncbi:MAG: hypothetical protein OXH92_07165 [Bryobacterales bacterium]|nr:hypothetical protein [Bryobacterales bacterium]
MTRIKDKIFEIVGNTSSLRCAIELKEEDQVYWKLRADRYVGGWLIFPKLHGKAIWTVRYGVLRFGFGLY